MDFLGKLQPVIWRLQAAVGASIKDIAHKLGIQEDYIRSLSQSCRLFDIVPRLHAI